MRWLIALIGDTGMRLGKAAGLRLTEIKLDAAIPHIDLQSHPRRSLKKRGSQRLISLVGGLLWQRNAPPTPVETMLWRFQVTAMKEATTPIQLTMV